MAANPNIKAVIWDFGGVFTSSPFEAFNRLEAELGAPKDHIRRVNATNHHENAWALFERNEIDPERFDQLFLEESTALGFGALVEVLQGLPVIGRDMDWKDFVADAVGVAAAFAVFALARRLRG